MRMAQIGATPGGGVKRIAFSEEDRRGRDLFVGWCRDAGCSIRIDRFGNIFARRPGRRADGPAVATGSHLDTQPTGGKFDGVYGVLAGLEVVRTLNDHGVETDAPLEIAVWTNEEGYIFKPMLGSSVFAGLTDLAAALALREERAGWSIGEALERTGYAGKDDVAPANFAAYFEAHIEQGPVLEASGSVIGVVTSSQAQRWYDLGLVGQEAHAGPTPMRVRRDALVGAARIILAADEIGRTEEHGRSTVGRLDVFPNSPNTIPGRVAFSVDLRHPSEAKLQGMHDAFAAAAHRIAGEAGLTLTFDQRTKIDAITFDAALVDSVRRMAAREGRPFQDIYTGAGHDACNIAKRLPTTMIFVPCGGGISHNEIESAEAGDLEAGCNVLCNAMLERAQVRN